MHSQGFATRNSAGAHKRLISTPRPPLKSLAAIKRHGSQQQQLGLCRPTLCRTRSAVPDRPERCSAHPPHNGFGRWRIAFGLRASNQSKHQALSSTNISTSTNTSAVPAPVPAPLEHRLATSYFVRALTAPRALTAKWNDFPSHCWRKPYHGFTTTRRTSVTTTGRRGGQISGLTGPELLTHLLLLSSAAGSALFSCCPPFARPRPRLDPQKWAQATSRTKELPSTLESQTHFRPSSW